MARVVAQYVFAALLALVSMHGVAPSARSVAPAVIVFCTRAERQVCRTVRLVFPHQRTELSAPDYVSAIAPEPDAPALFQRPPPASSL
jgi:hypothetical protein